MRARIAVLLFPLAASAACTRRLPPPSPQDPAARQALLLTDRAVAPGRHCQIVAGEAPLPDIASVLDTAGMPEYFRQAGITASSGYALFSLRFDSTGKPVRARLIEATIADSLAMPLQQAVASALLERVPAPPLAARLRIDFAAAPSYRLGKSEYCNPVLVGTRGGSAGTSIGRATGGVGLTTVNRLKYEVEISSTGEVTGVRFLSPPSIQTEDAMRRAIMEQHWLPALDDGLPVAVRYNSSTTVASMMIERPVR